MMAQATLRLIFLLGYELGSNHCFQADVPACGALFLGSGCD